MPTDGTRATHRQRSIRRAVQETAKRTGLKPEDLVFAIDVLEKRLSTRSYFLGRRKVLTELVEACQFNESDVGSEWSPFLWEPKPRA